MPAEWEPQCAVWICPPTNPETWPDRLDQAQAQFAQFINNLEPFVRVRDVRELGAQPYDAWIRDYGPLFVKHRRQSTLACHDFVFNSWGRKYEPWDQEDRVARYIARHLDCRSWRHDMVLEGGAIDVNGQGLVLTTRPCLLHPNRNPTLSRAQIERRLCDVLGTDRVIWLPGGIDGDDTDGHVDQVARFIQPGMVAAVRAPADHPDHTSLEDNWQVLAQQPVNLVELPLPDPMFFDFPSSRFGPAHRQRLPASYANFLISNGALFVPIFGQQADDRALRRLDDAMANHKILGIRCEHLLIGLGTLHCLTMQQPM